jgi:hypothetical protein
MPRIKSTNTKEEYLKTTKQKPKSNLIKSMNNIRKNANRVANINGERILVLPNGFSNTDYMFPASLWNSSQ